MSFMDCDSHKNLLCDVVEAQNLDENKQFLEAIRKYLTCLKALSDRLLIETYSTGLQMPDSSIENAKLCVMLSERIKDILSEAGNKKVMQASYNWTFEQYNSDVRSSGVVLKQNVNLIKVHQERVRFFVGNRQHSLDMNLMLQRKMSENIAIAERHRVNLEKKRNEKMQEIIEETERKFQNHGCLSEFEIHQKKVYSDVLKFEMNNIEFEELRSTSDKTIDEEFISGLIDKILRTKSHPLRTYLQGEQFKVCFKIKEILDKARSENTGDSRLAEKYKDEALSSIRKNYMDVMKMFAFIYEQLGGVEKMSVLNKCLEKHFYSSFWDFLKDLYRQSLGNTESHLTSLMKFCNKIQVKPSSLGVPENFQLVSESVPYEDAIRNFSTVVKHLPLSPKLNSLSDAFHSICRCVKQYSTRNELNLPEIGADELLPILSYCLVTSNTPAIFIECHILMDLTDDNQLLGENGYCLASVLTALDWLSKLSIDEENLTVVIPTSYN